MVCLVKLNIDMKDAYVEKFSAVLDEIHTFRVYPQVKIYVSVLLADHVEKTDFFVEPFGLRYMSITTPTSAKELGDNCLVVAGIFPGFRGMSDRYYVEIGSGSYSAAASVTGSKIFDSLAENFDLFRDGLRQISPPKFI
jgi:hypothetical protein